MVAMSSRLSSACGPMPESMRRRGESIAPADRITSREASIESRLPSTSTSRPMQRVPESRSLTTCTPVKTVSLSLCIAGRRKAVHGLQRRPSRTLRFWGPTPSGWGIFMSSR